MRYRAYQIHFTTNSKDQRRWIVEWSDERGEEGFTTQEEAFDYVDELMKKAGLENESTEGMDRARRFAREWEARRAEPRSRPLPKKIR